MVDILLVIFMSIAQGKKGELLSQTTDFFQLEVHQAFPRSLRRSGMLEKCMVSLMKIISFRASREGDEGKRKEGKSHSLYLKWNICFPNRLQLQISVSFNGTHCVDWCRVLSHLPTFLFAFSHFFLCWCPRSRGAVTFPPVPHIEQAKLGES